MGNNEWRKFNWQRPESNVTFERTPLRRCRSTLLVMWHRPLVVALLAGLACLPASFAFTREGKLIVSLVVVAAIGAASTVVARVPFPEHIKPRLPPMVLMFVVGVLVSEVVMFTHYYLTDGYNDPKLGVGVAVAIVEFGTVAAVGAIAMVLAFLIARRFRRYAA